MVFLEETDKALYEILKQMKIEGKTITITHAYPDKDLIETKYPLISFADFNIKRSPNQSNKHKVLVDINKENYKGTMQENKTYMDIYYQLDYWSMYKSDINKLLVQHLKCLKPLGYINAKDSEGLEVQIPCSLEDNYGVSDSYEDNKRIFRRSFTLKVVGYIEGDIEEVNLVRSNIIKVVKDNDSNIKK